MYLPTITTKIPAIFAIIAIAFSIIPSTFALANEEVPETPVEVAAKNNLQVSICLNETAINFNLEGECNFNSATTTATTTTTSTSENSGPEACEIEGHKYDATGTPLKDWTIGLMKVLTFSDRKVTKDLVNDVTDKDGYYCLEWDGYTNTEVVHEPHSFTYRVYEVLKEGWKYLSVEEGKDVDNLNVVADTDIETADGRVNVQIGEENGYIYANAAHHVDFYNTKDVDTVGGENGGGGGGNGGGGNGGNVNNGGNGGSNRNGSSGTRIKRAPAGEVLGASTTTPAGMVLGEATSTMPVGAPNTGAGGTAPITVSLPTLVAILSTTTRKIK